MGYWCKNDDHSIILDASFGTWPFKCIIKPGTPTAEILIRGTPIKFD